MVSSRKIDQPRPFYDEDEELKKRALDLGRSINDSEITDIYLVGCGGSLASFIPAEFIIRSSLKKPHVLAMTSNEFNFAPPQNLGKHSVVIVGSFTGTTKETVRAIATARKHDARKIISMSGNGASPLAVDADISFFTEPVKWAWDPKEVWALRIVQGMFGDNQLGTDLGYALDVLPAVISSVYSGCDDRLSVLAKKLVDVDLTSVISCGPNQGVGDGLAMFYLQEMLWKQAVSYNAGEFLHGPFEMAVPGQTYVLLFGEDETRPMMERVDDFLSNHTENVYKIDTRGYEMKDLRPQSRGLVSAVILSSITTRLAQHLEALLDHDLGTRRYMFHEEY